MALAIRFRFAAAVTAVALTATLGTGAPVLAAEARGLMQGVRAGSTVGLLVKLRHGAAVPSELSSARVIGGGWRVLDFRRPVSSEVAATSVNWALGLPGVVSADLNRVFGAAPARVSTPKFLSKPTFKGATAPQKASAIDAFATATPSTPRLNISWIKPKSLYGAKLVAYRIDLSFDSGKSFSTITSSVASKTTSFNVTSPLTAGSKTYLRVAAVTAVGKTKKVGAFTKWVSATPTTVPSEPTFWDVGISADNPQVSWEALTGAATGGLPVTYTAVASAAGNPPVECSSSGTSCNLLGLINGVAYTVQLKASNSRGASALVSGVKISDPGLAKQWYLTGPNGINVTPAWNRGATGKSVTVAVIDSGITDHPDLRNQLWQNSDGTAYGYDFVSDVASSGDGDGWDPDPSQPSVNADANVWHGTHVSGIIAAAANGSGVVGVAPNAKLLEVRALGSQGGTSADLVSALLWAAGKAVPGVAQNLHPAKVINLSMGKVGAYGCDSATAQTMQLLHSSGVTVVTAAGNDNLPALYSYPGNCYPTINVGATGASGDRASYGNYGLGVDISAPGGDIDAAPKGDPDWASMIYSTYNSGTDNLGSPDYDSLEGTSMAAPMVVGIAALLYSVRPALTPDQVWQALQVTARPFGEQTSCAAEAKAADPNTAQTCGVGIVDAGAAVEYVLKRF